MFPRHQEDRAERKARNLAALCSTPATRSATYSGATREAVKKESPARSEAYRRLVAAMPCADCRHPGPCQAAHANQGKGLALKTDDRTCFPLCPRCHRMHDQGAHTSREMRRDMEAQWGAATRAAILAAGIWPKNLPLWKEEA